MRWIKKALVNYYRKKRLLWLINQAVVYHINYSRYWDKLSHWKHATMLCKRAERVRKL